MLQQPDIHKHKPINIEEPIVLCGFVGPEVNSVEPPIEGNPCLLLPSLQPCPPPLFGKQTLTYCQSWPISELEPIIAVQCYTASGQPIQCCGHGLLTSAHWWLEHWQQTKLTLQMQGSRITARRDQARTWLQFARTHTHASPVPQWIQHLDYDTAPIAAAKAAGPSGYWVLQWPDGFPLSTLPAPGGHLGKFTQRALIYTALDTRSSVTATPSSASANIQMRYFAPQYGVDEDIATGSAMRILAEYWSPRYKHLDALQYSQAQGRLYSCHLGDSIDVGGFCRPQKNGF